MPPACLENSLTADPGIAQQLERASGEKLALLRKGDEFPKELGSE